MLEENQNQAQYDVCIVGTGRVGLPLGLSMMEVGVKVAGLDVDAELRAQVNNGQMPFAEPGYDELVARREMRVSGDPAIISQCAAVVVTVGTPLHTH